MAQMKQIQHPETRYFNKLDHASTLGKEELRYAQFGNKPANCGAGIMRSDIPNLQLYSSIAT